MISKKQLDEITGFLRWNVFRNMDIMYNLDFPGVKLDEPYTDKYHGEITEVDLTDIIASLHNLLYEAVYGQRYDYMFHHCNKIGADCLDNVFDGILEGEKDENSNTAI